MLVRLVEGVEGVEEFLFGPLLSGQELHVVHQPDVNAPVLLAEIVGPSVPDCCNVLGGEHLPGYVSYSHAGMLRQYVVTDGLEKVCLSEAGAAVEKERIVHTAGVLSDRLGGRVRQPVAWADNEARECVLVVQRQRERADGTSWLAAFFFLRDSGFSLLGRRDRKDDLHLGAKRDLQRGLDRFGVLLEEDLGKLACGADGGGVSVYGNRPCGLEEALEAGLVDLWGQERESLLPGTLQGNESFIVSETELIVQQDSSIPPCRCAV